MKENWLLEIQRLLNHRGDFALREIEFAAPARTVVVIPPERRAAFNRRPVQNPFDSAHNYFRLRKAQV